MSFSQFSVCRPDEDNQGVLRRHRHYCDVTLNVLIESRFQISSALDSDSDEFHIEIKENVVEEGEDNKVVVAPKARKRKVTSAYNSDDSDEKKEKTQK